MAAARIDDADPIPVRHEPPDVVERQFVGERDGVAALQRQMIERTKALGATWVRFTYLPEKDQIVLEGWFARPADDGPLPK